MKGLISGIKRMEIHDGDGVRTTVFFKGCTLKCVWCHNPESISFRPQTAFIKDKCIGCGICDGKRSPENASGCPGGALIAYGEEYEAAALTGILMRDAPFFRMSGGGVTLSGGECLAQPVFASEVARMLRENGISVYVDTCGQVPFEAFERIIPYADRFLYDIKAADAAVHARCTGSGNGLILDNLRLLSARGCDIEIRYPLVKGMNDGECAAIGALIRDIGGISRVKVLKYHRYARSRYGSLGMECTLPDTETTMADMEKAVETLKAFGLNAVNGDTDS